MNSYSRETLKRGHTPTATGPYAGPRGNPVMKAKRVTGPSANAIMNLRHTRDLEKERAKRGAAIAKDKATTAVIESMWYLR